MGVLQTTLLLRQWRQEELAQSGSKQTGEAEKWYQLTTVSLLRLSACLLSWVALTAALFAPLLNPEPLHLGALACRKDRQLRIRGESDGNREMLNLYGQEASTQILSCPWWVCDLAQDASPLWVSVFIH